MSHARYIIGDAIEVLRTLPDASVDMVMTSPPFLALRSYLPADHPDKAKEIGQESNPGAFLDVLLDVVVELRRVLAPHGSLCVELGDTYSGSGGAGGDYGDQGLREGQPKFGGSAGRRNRPADVAAGTVPPQKRPGPGDRDSIPGWPLAKSLSMIPSSFAWALAYGRNPWTGRELEPWRVRNLIAWCRPNPPVGALGDKFRPATSYMTVACVGGSRYFDLDAVRSEPSPNTHARTAKGVKERPNDCKTSPDGNRASLAIQHDSAGAPPLDYWVIPTHPYPGSHYATYPPDLCVKPIKAMCPERVCRVCGKPSERITKPTEWTHREHPLEREGIQRGGLGSHGDRCANPETLGWTDCDCPEHPPNMSGQSKWRRGVVLDPFAGSGTTLAVATGHGRDAIGIDLDPRNADLARERIGMFLEVT